VSHDGFDRETEWFNDRLKVFGLLDDLGIDCEESSKSATLMEGNRAAAVGKPQLELVPNAGQPPL
jgi:hypothetical protein